MLTKQSNSTDFRGHAAYVTSQIYVKDDGGATVPWCIEELDFNIYMSQKLLRVLGYRNKGWSKWGMDMATAYDLFCTYLINSTKCFLLPYPLENLLSLNSTPPGQNGRQFLQTKFSIAFSGMKMIKFRFKFHWNLFLGVRLTMNQHWFR